MIKGANLQDTQHAQPQINHNKSFSVLPFCLQNTNICLIILHTCEQYLVSVGDREKANSWLLDFYFNVYSS